MKKEDYIKLRNDLDKAFEIGREASKGEDGGTANLDTLCFRFNRARIDRLNELTGRRFYKTSIWRIPVYAVSTYFGQGNANTRGIEAMKEFLENKGWDVLIQYIND